MCFGPVRVRWNDAEDAGGWKVDNRLAILTALDLVEVSSEDAATGLNQFDFYFVARERIEATGAQLYFWFPYRTEPMPMFVGHNNNVERDRVERYLEWQRPYLDQSLRVKDPNSPRSYGWNEDAVRETLSIPNGISTQEAVRDYLIRAERGDFSLDDGITFETIEIEGAPSYHQHIVANLEGALEKGQIFHIYFKAKEAKVIPGDTPNSGEAPLYFYNRLIEEEEPYYSLEHPFKGAPVVPCAMLHFAMFYPLRANVTPEIYARFGASAYKDPIKSPTGTSFRDGRWFIFHNAHFGDKYLNFSNNQFYTKWDLLRRENDTDHHNMLVNPVFRNTEFEVDPDLLFVLMPFTEDWSDDVYHIIEKAGESEEYNVVRSDDIFESGNVVEKIWEMINRATLIVADITVHNANVFYEIGIAHTVGKNVVLIRQDGGDKTPFDLVLWRHFKYGLKPLEVEEFKDTLRKLL